MLTQSQILEIKRRGLAEGFSEKQVNTAIAELMKRDLNTQGNQQLDVTSQTSSNVDSVTSSSPTRDGTAAQPESRQLSNFGAQSSPNDNIVSSFFKSLYNTGANYASFVGEAAIQEGRSLIDPTIKTNFGKLNEEQDKLFQQSQDLIKQAKATTDPAEKKRLLDESKQIDAKIQEIGDLGSHVGSQKETFLIDKNRIEDRGEIALTGSKATAGAASLAVPGGGTLKGAVVAGAAAGALFGFSEGEDIDVNKIISGAVGGAVAGAVVAGVAPKAQEALKKGAEKIGGGYRKLMGKAEQTLSEEAAQRINKATPSQWQKALEEHGLDLNKLTEKYVSTAKTKLGKSGINYEDLLGETTKRGKGGLFRTEIDAAETQINKALSSSGKATKFTIDEMVDALQAEKTQLAKLPGNEGNIAALDEFINGFKAQYGKGITPKRLLELKRVADSKFGRAVADESTGSATAQAQKMVANAARVKLKKLLPDVASALDSETEIYTLQPVISRARAILNTQGSAIRVGSLSGKSVTELLNPFALADWYLSDPVRASKFVKSTATEAQKEAVKQLATTGTIPGFTRQSAGRMVGASIGTSFAPENSFQDDNQVGKEQNPGDYEGDNNDSSKKVEQDGTSLTKNNTDSISQQQAKPFGGRSKNELMQMAIAQGATYKDLQEIGQIYDLIVGKDDELSDEFLSTGEPQTRADRMWLLENPDKAPGAPKKSKATEKERQFQNAATAAQQALDLLQTGSAKSGFGQKFLGGIGEKLGSNSPEQQRYRASIALARTTARNALLGANMTEKELESIQAFIPEYDDAPNVAEEKLNTFIELMEQFSGMQVEEE